jgi:hypothetical protein
MICASSFVIQFAFIIALSFEVNQLFNFFSSISSNSLVEVVTTSVNSKTLSLSGAFVNSQNSANISQIKY